MNLFLGSINLMCVFINLPYAMKGNVGQAGAMIFSFLLTIYFIVRLANER